MQVVLAGILLMGLVAGCRTKPTSTEAPKPLSELRTPTLHLVDITFRGPDEIRVAAYRYNHLRFEMGQDLQADPPRNLVGIWCTDAELQGFVEKLRKDELFLRVEPVH